MEGLPWTPAARKCAHPNAVSPPRYHCSTLSQNSTTPKGADRREIISARGASSVSRSLEGRTGSTARSWAPRCLGDDGRATGKVVVLRRAPLACGPSAVTTWRTTSSTGRRGRLRTRLSSSRELVRTGESGKFLGGLRDNRSCEVDPRSVRRPRRIISERNRAVPTLDSIDRRTDRVRRGDDPVAQVHSLRLWVEVERGAEEFEDVGDPCPGRSARARRSRAPLTGGNASRPGWS